MSYTLHCLFSLVRLANFDAIINGMRIGRWFFAFFLLVPVVAFAQQGGLVPCNDLISCNLCSFGQLIQNLINFGIGIAIPLSALAFLWAGIVYFTASANPAKIERAKSIFKNVFIGFVIAVSAWLIVQTILSTLVSGDYFIGGKWNNLQCSSGGRQVTGDVSELFNSALSDNGLVSAPPPPPQSQLPGGFATQTKVCGGGEVYNYQLDFCENPLYPGEPDYSQTPQIIQYGGVSGGPAFTTLQSLCSERGDLDCNLAAAVMKAESGGDCGQVGPTGDWGCMQVTCGAAQTFSSGVFNNSTPCSVIKQAMLTNPQLNMSIGMSELAYCSAVAKPRDVPTIAACYNGGVGAIQRSNVCNNGLLVYQCTLNTGYAVTRNYVVTVQNYFQQFSGFSYEWHN